jgi:hypothetical protein
MYHRHTGDIKIVHTKCALNQIHDIMILRSLTNAHQQNGEYIMAKAKQANEQVAQSDTVEAAVPVKQTSANKLADLLKKLNIQITDDQIAAITPYVSVKNPRKDEVKYTLGNVELTATDKVPQQMRIIVENLHQPMSMAEWAAEVAKDERFTTKQDVSKVIMYYRKAMLDKNLVAITE